MNCPHSMRSHRRPRSRLRLRECTVRKPERSRPRAAWIQTAEYSARIDDTQFRDGRLTLELINNAPGPTAIPLAPLGLAIASLQQDGRPLIWGTTAHRTIVLVAPPGRSTVTGQWSLQGRKVVSLEEFDVRLAPAVQTSLVLDVPVVVSLLTSVLLIGFKSRSLEMFLASRRLEKALAQPAAPAETGGARGEDGAEQL